MTVKKSEILARFDEIRKETMRTSKIPVHQINQKAGAGGFFYVVSRDGIIVWHPFDRLRGTDVSDLSIIKEFFQKEKGYGLYDQGGLKRVIFYQILPNGSMLLASVDPAEFEENK